jgi:hypothetical protein
MLTATVTAAALAVLAVQGIAGQGKPVKEIKEGALDLIKLYAEKPPAAMRVVMKPFSTAGVEGDSEETKKMKVDAPPMLATQFATKLKALGPYTDVAQSDAAAPADALVVDGKFTEIDPGSRAKRYLVGFGAGKSGVSVAGTVKSGSGTLLAEFEQRRIGAMGAFGGDSMGKLTSDTKDIGEDIAKFLSAWAKGGKLN